MRLQCVAASVFAAICFTSVPALASDTRDATFGAIGDLPYSAADIARFPGWINDINKDTRLGAILHVGDTKSGSTSCNNAFYTTMAGQLNSFTAPVVYTPGDNEWTDCHREKAGKFHPLNRLAQLRKTHFAKPGWTMGKSPMKVDAQPGIPENVRYRQHGVTFSTVHVVGSNNSAAPWAGLGLTQETAEQRLERFTRTQASIAWLKQAFDQARTHGDRAVVVAMQADMFEGDPTDSNNSSFTGIVRALAREAANFGKPVYLIDGDSHTYTVDKPLAERNVHTQYYGVTTFAPNLTRITVDGEAKAAKGWLKFTIHDSGPDVLTWSRVPFSS